MNMNPRDLDDPPPIPEKKDHNEPRRDPRLRDPFKEPPNAPDEHKAPEIKDPEQS